MQYLIMLLIVIGLAVSDFLTGLIKGYVNNKINSKAMRRGGVNKLGEIVIMTTACGLEIGLTQLGKFYGQEQLAGVAGAFTAGAVFCYLVTMEIISILENYAEINPAAAWALKITKRLKVAQDQQEQKSEEQGGAKHE